jgi:hypothetical protein
MPPTLGVVAREHIDEIPEPRLCELKIRDIPHFHLRSDSLMPQTELAGSCGSRSRELEAGGTAEAGDGTTRPLYGRYGVRWNSINVRAATRAFT